MDLHTKVELLLQYLAEDFPEPKIPLHHQSAYQLLFATILSAQTTDARVNMITPMLFARFKSLEEFAAADVHEISEIIRSIGFYNSKAKYLKGAALKLLQDFEGKVPDKIEQLITLPGVARKTASVVLWQWYGLNQGFTVDTHVIRLTNWLGLVDSDDPVKIEQQMMQIIPQDLWGITSLRIILLGRSLLTARNPKYKGTKYEKLLVPDRMTG